jgi:epoxide hydrolase-like predicted phosphatase
VVQAVIFDCFGTLHPDPVLSYRHDGKTPEHTVAALQDIHDRAAVGLLNKEMYIERAARLLDQSPEAVEKQFFHGEHRNQPLLELILSLRQTYKTGLLTNAGAGMLEGLFSPEELHMYFDTVVQTYMIKVAKPDPAVFRWTCEQLGVPPEQVVMVDDVPENCAAARAIGMQAVQYEDLEQAKAELDQILSASSAASGAVSDV